MEPLDRTPLAHLKQLFEAGSSQPSAEIDDVTNFRSANADKTFPRNSCLRQSCQRPSVQEQAPARISMPRVVPWSSCPSYDATDGRRVLLVKHRPATRPEHAQLSYIWSLKHQMM